MVYQCMGQRAEVPFLIRDAGMAVYSIEELCYYIRENMFMLDPSFLDSELIDYIRRELMLPELSEKLFVVQKNGGSFSDFVETLFRETFYVTESELNTIRRALSVKDSLSAYEKHRIRGDFLMKCGRAAPAVLEYTASLEKMDTDRMPREGARLLHNMGVAFVSQFLFDKAAEYFARAAAMDPSAEDTREQLLSAKKLSLSEEEYKKWLAAEGIEDGLIQKVEEQFRLLREKEGRRGDMKRLQDLKNLKNAGETAAWKSGTSDLLFEWKQEYRR